MDRVVIVCISQSNKTIIINELKIEKFLIAFKLENFHGCSIYTLFAFHSICFSTRNHSFVRYASILVETIVSHSNRNDCSFAFFRSLLLIRSLGLFIFIEISEVSFAVAFNSAYVSYFAYLIGVYFVYFFWFFSVIARLFMPGVHAEWQVEMRSRCRDKLRLFFRFVH